MKKLYKRNKELEQMLDLQQNKTISNFQGEPGGVRSANVSPRKAE